MRTEHVVTEGISGLWHYHLSTRDKPHTSLCGRQVMGTSMPLTDWQKPFGQHFPKHPTWCAECHQQYQRQR